MNKKGQTLGLGIISAIFVFIVGIMFVNFIMDDVTTARTDLNCAGTISDGTKLLCLGMDATVFYFMIVVFSITIGIITSRLAL